MRSAFDRTVSTYWSVLCLLLLSGCASSPKLTTDPIKWADPDNRHIPEPEEMEENQIWDVIDHTLFYEFGKLLDLGWTARRTGNILGVAPVQEADNVNALDEVPNSSWFTNRHFLERMSLDELRRGPGLAQPDTSGSWEIVAGKFEGGTAGFTIRDPKGALFLLKFDSEGNNEMGSAAEVIATKILHAAGYNVPSNSVVTFDPAILEIGRKARVPDGRGGKRSMNRSDVRGTLDNIIPQSDGRLRCVASRFLSGIPAGVFNYHSKRRDDPNDRVRHQHRRELRGLRVIGSWMNDADRRAANTLDMYVADEEGRRYLKHYIIDMGSTFGSNNLMPHKPKYGNEYLWDARTVGLSLISLGLYRKAWDEPLPMKYPELGYFENETFRPGRWVPTYPNPAFERCTARDGYWGAKIVMSFSDEEIAAMVQTGHYSNPDATAELTRLLIERRDMIGKYWFDKINPLDKFWIDPDGLRFEDQAVNGNLASAEGTTYRYTLIDAEGNPVGPIGMHRGEVTLKVPAELPPRKYYGFRIQARRPGRSGWGKATNVYFYAWQQGRYQIVRVERES